MPENRKKQANSGQFKKGQSGNPGGRPKLENGDELRAALKMHAPEAVDYLGRVLKDPNAGATAKLAAAQAILDRCFGKPVQAVDSRVSVDTESYDEWVKKRLQG